MNNDLERVTKLADDTLIRSTDSDGLLIWEGYPQDILAFEQAVLAKRDEEIESLQAKLAMQAEKLEVSRLFLESIAHLVTDKVDSMPDSKVVTQAEHTKRWQTKCAEMWGVINDDNEPAQADVDAFMQGKKAESLAEVYSLIEDFGSDFTLQRLKDVMKDRGVR